MPAKKLRTLPDSKIDWEQIGKEYCFTSKSVRQIAAEQPCSDGFRPLSHHRISRRAREKAWQRDKTKEVKQLTENALITAEENIPERPNGTNDSGREITAEDIRKAVNTNVSIVLSHRKLSKAHKENIKIQINLLNESLTHLQSMMKSEELSHDDRLKAIHAYEELANKAALTTQRLTSALGGIVQIERLSYNLLQLPPDLDPNHPDHADQAEGKGAMTFMPPPIKNVNEWVEVMEVHMKQYRKKTHQITQEAP